MFSQVKYFFSIFKYNKSVFLFATSVQSRNFVRFGIEVKYELPTDWLALAALGFIEYLCIKMALSVPKAPGVAQMLKDGARVSEI